MRCTNGRLLYFTSLYRVSGYTVTAVGLFQLPVQRSGSLRGFIRDPTIIALVQTFTYKYLSCRGITAKIYKAVT